MDAVGRRDKRDSRGTQARPIQGSTRVGSRSRETAGGSMEGEHAATWTGSTASRQALPGGLLTPMLSAQGGRSEGELWGSEEDDRPEVEPPGDARAAAVGDIPGQSGKSRVIAPVEVNDVLCRLLGMGVGVGSCKGPRWWWRLYRWQWAVCLPPLGQCGLWLSYWGG